MSVTRVCRTCGFTSTYASQAMAEHHHNRHSCAKQQRRRELARARAVRAESGPKRNCRHPRAKHQHGTRTAYVRDRCRCLACTTANTAASNQMNRPGESGDSTLMEITLLDCRRYCNNGSPLISREECHRSTRRAACC